MRVPIVLTLLLVLTASVGAQQYGRFVSDPRHAISSWFSAYSLPNANYYDVYRALKADTTVNMLKPSKEVRKVLRWLAEQRAYADASGVIGPKWSSSDDINNFLAKSFPSKQVDQSQRVDGQWIPIGPFGWDTTARMATGSQGIGVLRTHITDPTNSSVILAGGISSGIWRSVDAGKTWTNVALSTPIQTVWRFAFSGSTVYAATSDGLYTSNDRGLTWTKITLLGDALLSTARAVDLVAVAPLDPKRIVIAALNRLYTSTDAGSTWRQSCNFEGTWWDLLWHPTKNEVCYGLVQQGAHISFIRSTSTGVKFDAVGIGYPASKPDRKMARALLAVTPASPDMVGVAIGGSVGDSLSGTYGLYISTDQGSTFEHRCCGSVDGPERADKNTNPNLFDYNIEGNSLGQITWDMGFAISSTDPSFMVIAGIFPYKSSDGGRSWSSLPPMHYDVQSVSIRGDSLWITTDGGIQLSPDRGKSLLERSFGISASEIWGFDQSHDGTVMAIGAYHLPITIRDTSVYMKSQPVDGWYAWSGADAMGANVNPIASEWLYAKPWSSVRGLRTASRAVPPSSTALGIDLGYITMDNIQVDAYRYYKLYAIDYEQDRVVVSNDNASTWQTVKKFTNWAFRLRVHPRLSEHQLVFGDDALWRTTDAGATWKNITPPQSLTRGRGMSDIAFSDRDPEVIYLTFSGTQKQIKAAVSNDGGITWSNLSQGLPEAAVRTIVHRRGTQAELYAGTNAGVYRYTPETGWQIYGTGLPLCEAHTLHINERNGLMRVATSRGLWQIDLPSSAVPRAQISLDIDTVRCSRIPVRFGCRSAALESVGFARSWRFEGGQPSVSSDPTVQVFYAKPGRYAVELVVANEHGADTMRMEQAVTVLPSECDGSDPVPGFAADLTDPDDHVTLGRYDGAAREFTFTAWVKPNGYQPNFSAVLCTDADPGVSQEIGLQFVNDRNELGYLWTGGQWWWNSGLRLEPDVWSHVALTVDSNGATVFVNGYPSTNAVKLSPLQLGSLTFTLGTYHYWSSRNFSGLIDEVSIYARKLSESEIRRLMHLVRLSDESNLLAYYQFNESHGPTLYEKKSGRDGRLEGGARRAASGALVGPGVGQVVTVNDSMSALQFTRHEAQITFANPVPPNTVLSLTRLYVLPDEQLRKSQSLLGSWFVLDAFTLDKRPLEVSSIIIGCDSLFTREQATGRSFAMQSRFQWEVDSPFSFGLVPSSLVYNAANHSLSTTEISRGMITSHQLCIGYDGAVVTAEDNSSKGGKLSAHAEADVLRITGSESLRSIELYDTAGRIVLSQNDVVQTSCVVSISHLPTGVYILVSNQCSIPVVVIR
jgi:photosystem II stability/assembly factor-like uncharacterized protein/PKD repeat protein